MGGGVVKVCIVATLFMCGGFALAGWTYDQVFKPGKDPQDDFVVLQDCVVREQWHNSTGCTYGYSCGMETVTQGNHPKAERCDHGCSFSGFTSHMVLSFTTKDGQLVSQQCQQKQEVPLEPDPPYSAKPCGGQYCAGLERHAGYQMSSHDGFGDCQDDCSASCQSRSTSLALQKMNAEVPQVGRLTTCSYRISNPHEVYLGSTDEQFEGKANSYMAALILGLVLGSVAACVNAALAGMLCHRWLKKRVSSPALSPTVDDPGPHVSTATETPSLEALQTAVGKPHHEDQLPTVTHLRVPQATIDLPLVEVPVGGTGQTNWGHTSALTVHPA